MSGNVVTRFAPSPTGFLHIGGARTALFNWMFARAQGGRFLLRIEDTDRSREFAKATEAIFNDLKWLGVEWNGEAVFQSSRVNRHVEVAERLLMNGNAYRCFATPEEMEAARKAGQRSPWRDRNDASLPDRSFAIRLKTPVSGFTEITDSVFGRVRWKGQNLEDLVLLRTNGTPTYNLAVVVDDHDMQVTHVIRGDDHLANTAKQVLIYRALGWDLPVFAHVPLIHSASGKKLSKREGGATIDHYRSRGYIPEAVRNYLTRLGWSHGDLEVFKTNEVIGKFALKGLRKSPSRLDDKKLANLSQRHIALADDDTLIRESHSFMAYKGMEPFNSEEAERLRSALFCLKDRSRTIPDLLKKSEFLFVERPVVLDDKARKAAERLPPALLDDLLEELGEVSWTAQELDGLVRNFCKANGIGMGIVAQAIRAGLCGCLVSPSVFDMMPLIGREESLNRMRDLRDRAGRIAKAQQEAPTA